MFKKILIANRGEIAVRILRACRELGIRSVAVFSDVDRKSLHVRLADEAYPIGPAPSRESYLCIDKLIDVARRSGCDAVHPGYGFLAENAALPRACVDAGLTFIGPPASAMESLGSKTAGRQLARNIDVPTVPGTNDPIEKPAEAHALTPHQDGCCRGAPGARRRLFQRLLSRIPRRRQSQFLFLGSESPLASRTSLHLAGHRPRPGETPNCHRRRPPLALRLGVHHTARPRHGSSSLRRRS